MMDVYLLLRLVEVLCLMVIAYDHLSRHLDK